MRIISAGGDFVPRHRARLLGIREATGGTSRGDGHVGVRAHVAVDHELINSVSVADDLDHPLAVGRFGVLLPHAARLENVPVSIDDRCHNALLILIVGLLAVSSCYPSPPSSTGKNPSSLSAIRRRSKVRTRGRATHKGVRWVRRSRAS